MERVGSGGVEAVARQRRVELRQLERGGEGGWLAGPSVGSLGYLEALSLEDGLVGQEALVIWLADSFVDCFRFA